MLPGLEWLGFETGFPGKAGVRIFFVLSGFIISYTYWNRDWSFKFGASTRDFYWNRFARIYPLHWLMFLAALPLGLNSPTARITVSHIPVQLALIDRLWPGFFSGSMPVKAAWTLSCEVLFYLSTPLLFWFLTRRKNPLLASINLLVIFTGGILALDLKFPGLDWTAYIELPQFLLGIVGYHLTQRVNLSRWANPLIVGGLLLIGVAGYFNRFLHIEMINYTSIAPGALLLILGCATASGRVGSFLSRPFVVLLGHASYALYLMHDPTLRYLRVILYRKEIVFSFPVSIMVAITVFCLITAASIVCFKFYENPMRLKLRSLMKHKPQSAQAI